MSALLRAKRRTEIQRYVTYIEMTEVESEGWCICTYKGWVGEANLEPR